MRDKRQNDIHYNLEKAYRHVDEADAILAIISERWCIDLDDEIYSLQSVLKGLDSKTPACTDV